MKFKKSRRPFNLPEDKTWILLANYGDRSLVRTALGYDIGAGLDGLDVDAARARSPSCT